MKRIYYSLYDRMLQYNHLVAAFEKVRKANGKPGVDGQTVEEFHRNIYEEFRQLSDELKNKTYRPSPVLRVLIPKPDGGKRPLGIPTVRDRVVQHMLLGILQPIFEEDFHPRSYGYRPKRSGKKAVLKAQIDIQKNGYKHVVDMDLSKCFDKLDHRLIIKLVRQRVTDGSILNLIRMFLESGVSQNGCLEQTEIGSPQGGPISPLIANIYLNVFDRELERRGYRFVRYADDILILCRSQRSAAHAMSVAVDCLEGELRLKVNRRKTCLTQASKGVTFLGFVIGVRFLRIAEKRIVALKTKVKELTRRSGQENLRDVIAKLNPVLRGWTNYFRIANCTTQLRQLQKWIRRRLRARQITLWKDPAFQSNDPRLSEIANSFRRMKKKAWRLSRTPSANKAISNRVLLLNGLFDVGRIQVGNLRRG